MTSHPVPLTVLAACALAVASACAGRPGESASAGSSVAARVGDRTITVDELDAAAKNELTRVEMERYQIRKTKLEQMVDDVLIADKAKGLGITPEELVKREVTDKVSAPSEDLVKQYFERFKSQGTQGNYEDFAPRIRTALSGQQTAARRAEFIAGLKKEAKVSIQLTPPRVQVSTAGGYESGPKDAPITLVEFSDFQCPFCGRSQSTVAQVLAKYEGKVHHVFMDFPLTAIHAMAEPAALAGRCANEQGKFWEYHKVLFERQKDLSADNLKKWAGELGLDQAKFDECVASNKYKEAIQQSIDVGQKAGVSGTPGFFVNGIMISGAQPFEAFQQVIDDELSRAKS